MVNPTRRPLIHMLPGVGGEGVQLSGAGLIKMPVASHVFRISHFKMAVGYFN